MNDAVVTNGLPDMLTLVSSAFKEKEKNKDGLPTLLSGMTVI